MSDICAWTLSEIQQISNESRKAGPLIVGNLKQVCFEFVHDDNEGVGLKVRNLLHVTGAKQEKPYSPQFLVYNLRISSEKDLDGLVDCVGVYGIRRN